MPLEQMRIHEAVLQTLFDILSGIMIGLDAIQEQSGMPVTDIRVRIARSLYFLLKPDPAKRVELLDPDKEFVEAINASMMLKNRDESVREDVANLCALIIQYDEDLTPMDFCQFDMEARD